MEQDIQELWYNVKRYNISVIEILGKEVREKGLEVFKGLVTKSFPKLRAYTKPQTQENQKPHTHAHTPFLKIHGALHTTKKSNWKKWEGGLCPSSIESLRSNHMSEFLSRQGLQSTSGGQLSLW